MARIHYTRVSSDGQSLEAQRQTLGEDFDKEFSDFAISGATPAAQRPGFARMLDYAREGDVIHVAAVDRLGRDAIDVQSTVRALLSKGVSVDVHGLGVIGRGVGELILAVLAQVADMERMRIRERCDAGRAAARASLAESGKTHRGKASMGRPVKADAAEVLAWRRNHGASISETAQAFGLSASSVKRYVRLAPDAQ